MDRPSRYKVTAAYQRRVPLAEAPSKGNSGAPVPQILKPSHKNSQQRAINDENIAPSGAMGMTNTRQQDIDKRMLATHTQSYHAFLNGLRPRKTHIGPWQLGVTVGQGGSCTVRLVRHAKTGETAVAKIIHKSTAEKVRARSLIDLMLRVERGDQRLGGKFPMPIALEREIVIMRLLNHPNIVQIYDVWENQDEIYLIMENVDGGELFQYLTSRGALHEEEAVYIFRQLVEALAYCHKMSIFHRDLKPENILLDKKTFTVKLIDFGMAAYQPSGNKLKTPCGSPHYAAPELLQGLAYDGGKADVWSLGVVLYLMLVGDLPFNFRHDDPENLKLRNLYNLILAADINIPNKLSFEAQNLLRKVFVPDPSRRLDILELWHQPLLHKYDRKYGMEGRILNTWTRNMPSKDDWTALDVDTIDKGLFRNLLTLWHDVKEDVMIKQLCSDEMNEEKYFYLALKKYSEEQLDSMDYSPARSGLVISASDYHHSHIISAPSQKRSHNRSNSQFSVYHEEHLISKHSFFEDLDEGHFDPFGIEGDQSINETGASSTSQVPTIRVLRHGVRVGTQRNSVRIEPSKRRGSMGISGIGKGSASNTSGQLSSSSRRTHSTGSIKQTGSPAPIVIRPSDKHKRNVSFDLRRRNASQTTSSGTLTASMTPERTSSGLPLPSSPPSGTSTPMKSSYFSGPTPRSKKLKEFEAEARKVSNELGKVCEEAFFRSSLSESSIVSTTSNSGLNPADTPASTLSNQSSAKIRDQTGMADKSVLDRPLPPSPPSDDTPSLYTSREIQQIRNRLALRYAQDGASNQKYFNDILLQLDRLARPIGGIVKPEMHKRGGNSVHHSSDLNLLQSIPEESRGDEQSSVESSVGFHTKAGAQNIDNQASFNLDRKATIRVVELSPPGSPTIYAPLKLRKDSGMSEKWDLTSIRNSGEALDDDDRFMMPKRSKTMHEGPIHKRSEAISPVRSWEDLDDRTSSRRDRQAQFQNRSKHIRNGEEHVVSSLHQTAPYYSEKDQDTTMISTTDEWGQPLPETSPVQGKRGGFFWNLFQRKQLLQKSIYNVDKTSSMNTLDKLSEEFESGVTINPKQKTLSKEWNLLHRLLRIRPESRVIVMCHSRRVARNIIGQLMLAQDHNGIEDFVRDTRNRNLFTGNLIKDNAWSLKPVSFAVELFSILRDGKGSKLTAVRFTQTKGSAQSLRKMVDMLSTHLQEHHLHDNAKETKEIVSLIKTGRPDIKDC